MPKTYTITNTQLAEIAKARKANHDKQVEKRLHAVQLRGEGKKNAEIGKQLETSPDVVSPWMSWYVNGSAEALLPKKREAHRFNMSYAEEASFLAEYGPTGRSIRDQGSL